MMNFEKLVVDSIELVTMFDTTSDALMLMLDEVKDGSIENGVETVFQTGRGGVKLSALDRNKTAKLSVNNAYVVAGAIAAATGTNAKVATVAEPILVPKYLDIKEITASDINNGKVTVSLDHVAVGTTGAEALFAYKLTKEGAQGKEFTVATTASTGKFAIDAAGKKATFAEADLEVGDQVLVIYDYYATDGARLDNSMEEYSKTGKIVIDLLCRDVCDNNKKYYTKFVFPTAKVDGNFTLTIGDEIAQQPFAAEALITGCGKKRDLWSWYIVEG